MCWGTGFHRTGIGANVVIYVCAVCLSCLSVCLSVCVCVCVFVYYDLLIDLRLPATDVWSQECSFSIVWFVIWGVCMYV